MPINNSAPANDEMLERLNEFSNVLHGNFQIDDVGENAVRLCRKMLNARASAIYLVERKSIDDTASPHSKLVLKYCEGYDNINDDLYNYFYDLEDEEDKKRVTAQIAIEKKSRLVRKRSDFRPPGLGNDTGGKYDDRLWKDPETCKSFVGVPMIFSNECIGVLKVESAQEDYYEENHQKFIEVLGLMVAAAISSREFLDELGNATKLLAASRNDEEILQNVVRQCAQLCHSETASLFLYDEKIGGLILRADHGHDFNLSNKLGDDDDRKKYIYHGNQEPTGLTWQCYHEHKESSFTNSTAINNAEDYVSKLWPGQWQDKNKKCNSVYMYPVKDENATKGIAEDDNGNKTYGVLKVENKLDISGKNVINMGFTNQDQFVIKLFADTIAMLLRDSTTFYGKAYLPKHIFGGPIIDILAQGNFKSKLKDLDSQFGEILANKLLEFSNKQQANKDSWRTLGEFSNEVVAEINQIASLFSLKNFSRPLLSKIRNFEFILNQIPEYRHHFIHQFNVFLLGLIILVKNEKIYTQLKSKLGQDKVLKEWFVVSMFHDIGLPVEKFQEAFTLFIKGSLRINRDIRFSLPAFSILSIEEFHKTYMNISENLSLKGYDSIINETKTTLHRFAFPNIGDETSQNHSFVSACIVDKYLDDKMFDDVSRRRIVNSILFHDRRLVTELNESVAHDHDLKEMAAQFMSLKNNPLTFLLALCDTMQNWGRPEVGSETESPTESPTMEHSVPTMEHSILVELDKLEISDSNIKAILNYSAIPRNWKFIFDKVIKPQASLWRNNIKNLDIEIEFRNHNNEPLDPDHPSIKFAYKQDKPG